MKVQDVMTDEVQTCSPETNLATVAMQMWRGDFGAMPVVAGRKVVGMITDRDICMAAATKHRDPANIRVKEVISGQVYGCSCDTDIHEALKIMQQKTSPAVAHYQAHYQRRGRQPLRHSLAE